VPTVLALENSVHGGLIAITSKTLLGNRLYSQVITSEKYQVTSGVNVHRSDLETPLCQHSGSTSNSTKQVLIFLRFLQFCGLHSRNIVRPVVLLQTLYSASPIPSFLSRHTEFHASSGTFPHPEVDTKNMTESHHLGCQPRTKLWECGILPFCLFV